MLCQSSTSKEAPESIYQATGDLRMNTGGLFFVITSKGGGMLWMIVVVDTSQIDSKVQDSAEYGYHRLSPPKVCPVSLGPACLGMR